ncbi:DUF937 domain-containing protein [Bradyrhizobium septentrionale]|uniref:DUF937 domain-containing protein n=1 Tax=Bradyrhizobium septentrionale TaxID=1404411 RepID=A0A973W9G4_9BRAD|nr:DUF937 domain-containing protein [Bradyrhizobium septentrionale]UGY18688.1 DUF937 domain-containing protein [Bradyrhizobium septentrionale]UGY27400.1 DUF937 domain-containing protein [Bradyrhizobium septentrionale]
MAANLVSVVMQFLTPDMVAKIASVLGIDRNVAQKAIGGAIPALLAGLADVTATPQGARQLSSSLAQQQPGSLDILKSLIGGSGQNNLAETGSNMLSGLFGGGALDTIAQSIGKFAGIDGQASKSLLGMLGPVVLGTLGQQQRSAGLDTNGLASLLGSQKDQIVAAIPSGLADHLTSAGLIDRAAGVARSGAAAASAAGSRIAGVSERTSAEASRAAQATTSAASSQLSYWLAAVAILGALAWYFFQPRTETVAELPRPAAVQPGTATVGLAPSDLTIGGVSLTNKVNSSVGTLRSVLPTITDVASAQAAIPKLREATAQLNEVSDLAGKLSPEGKSALAKLIATAKPTINQMCDNVLAMPGVGDVAKPTIDELRRKIETLSRS